MSAPPAAAALALPRRRGRSVPGARLLWLLLGWLCLALALAGALLPLLPTTVFLIMAAACFGTAAPHWEARLLAHPRFGRALRDWRERRAISRRAKFFACAGIALGLLSFLLRFQPGWLLAGAVALPMLACAIYLLSRPSPLPPAEGQASSGTAQPGPWGLLASVLVHGLVLLWLLQEMLSAAKPPAQPPQERPVLLQARLLPAAAPPQPVALRRAPLPSPERPQTLAKPRPLKTLEMDVTQALPAQALPVLLAAPATSGSLPLSAPAPAAPAHSQATAAAAPPAPALPPAAQAGGIHSDSWQARVLARLENYRSYPPGARARREQGVAQLQLRVDRQGRVLSARLQRSSGHGELDQAALATVRRAQPLPPIPPELPAELELLVPVEFFIS